MVSKIRIIDDNSAEEGAARPRAPPPLFKPSKEESSSLNACRQDFGAAGKNELNAKTPIERGEGSRSSLR